MKTMEELIKEKALLSSIISTEVNIFLKNNPEVSDINFIKSWWKQETKCGLIKEIEVIVKIEL